MSLPLLLIVVAVFVSSFFFFLPFLFIFFLIKRIEAKKLKGHNNIGVEVPPGFSDLH